MVMALLNKDIPKMKLISYESYTRLVHNSQFLIFRPKNGMEPGIGLESDTRAECVIEQNSETELNTYLKQKRKKGHVHI